MREFSFELEIRREERSRIGRELHDSTAQLLVALQLSIASLAKNIGKTDCGSLFSMLDSTLHELHRELRAVASDEVAPALLSGQLPAALRNMADEFAKLTGLRISVDLFGPYFALSSLVELSLYRIAQEALANVQKHANAQSVRIRLGSTRSSLIFVIEDDGTGFPQDKDSLDREGRGLKNMRARVRDIGGRFSLRRLPRGSQIAVVISLRRLTGGGGSANASYAMN